MTPGADVKDSTRLTGFGTVLVGEGDNEQSDASPSGAPMLAGTAYATSSSASASSASAPPNDDKFRDVSRQGPSRAMTGPSGTATGPSGVAAPHDSAPVVDGSGRAAPPQLRHDERVSTDLAADIRNLSSVAGHGEDRHSVKEKKKVTDLLFSDLEHMWHQYERRFQDTDRRYALRGLLFYADYVQGRLIRQPMFLLHLLVYAAINWYYTLGPGVGKIQAKDVPDVAKELKVVAGFATVYFLNHTLKR